MGWKKVGNWNGLEEKLVKDWKLAVHVESLTLIGGLHVLCGGSWNVQWQSFSPQTRRTALYSRLFEIVWDCLRARDPRRRRAHRRRFRRRSRCLLQCSHSSPNTSVTCPAAAASACDADATSQSHTRRSRASSPLKTRPPRPRTSSCY